MLRLGGVLSRLRKPLKPLMKVDIVHHLAERYDYRRYLEIATITTGNFYAQIDRRRFEDCLRLMYRCPPDYADGLAVDYRCPDLDIAPALAAIAAEKRRFDIVLVDPFHTYADSLRDLSAAFDLLDPGGAMVVHDCLPPNKEIASPHYVQGPWCGVTYRAFVDFVIGRSDLRYCTVDADFGCGIVRKLPPIPAGWFAARRDRRQIAAWRRVGDDEDDAWRYFEANRRSLLRLVSARAFLAGRHDLG